MMESNARGWPLPHSVKYVSPGRRVVLETGLQHCLAEAHPRRCYYGQVILVINQQSWTHTMETVIQQMPENPDALRKHHQQSCEVEEIKVDKGSCTM